MASPSTIVIGAAQMAALRRQRLAAFVDALSEHLDRRYPGWTGCLAGPAQRQVVAHLVAHGRARGLTWQSSLATYADMMIGLAPNVHELDDVRDVLALPGPWADRALVCLDPEILLRTWRAEGRFANHLPLFVPPEALALPRLEQTTMAVALALGERLRGQPPSTLARAALERAVELSLDVLPDAGLVIAAWRLMYAPRADSLQEHPWLAAVLHPSRLPQEVIALLRWRLRADHGLMV